MRKVTEPTSLEEVERLRQVRRELERTHGGIDGLSDWLATLQKRKENKSKRAARRPAARSLAKNKSVGSTRGTKSA